MNNSLNSLNMSSYVKKTPKVVAIIQARMGSKRLPGKSLMQIAGKPLIEIILARVLKAKSVNQVILAIPEAEQDDVLADLAGEFNVIVVRGSEENVLSRFIKAARLSDADVVVRICADNPLIDPDEIDRAVIWHIDSGADYTFNNIPSQKNFYPDGLGAEVIDAGVMCDLENKPLSPEDCEHVTQYIIDRPGQYHVEEFPAPLDIIGPYIKLDIDTLEDFTRMKQFIEQLPPSGDFGWNGPDIVKSYKKFFKPKIIIIFEKPEHVLQCPESLLISDGEIKRIATTPGACWELEKLGLSYCPIEEFYNNDYFYSIGLKNYEIVDRICSSFDDRLIEFSPCVKKYGIKIGTSHYYQIKNLFDTLMWVNLALDGIREREKPDIIYSFVNLEIESDKDKQNIFISDNENLFNLAINFRKWTFIPVSLQIRSRKNAKENGLFTNNKKSIRQYVCRFFQSRNSLKNFLYYLKKLGILKALVFVPFTIYATIHPEKRIGLLNFGYNWNYLLPFFYRNKYYIINFTSTDLITQYDLVHNSSDFQPDACGTIKDLDTSIRNILPNELFKVELTFGDNDVSRFFFERIYSGFSTSLFRIEHQCYVIQEKITNASLELLLCGPKVTFQEQLFATIARQNGIPVLCYQHGSLGQHDCPIMLYQERMNTDYHFVWGNGVKEYIENSRITVGGCQSIPVGSFELEDLKMRYKKYPTTRKNILYITSAYYHNSRYVSLSPPRQDNSFWCSQQKILSGLQDSGMEVIVKLHPSESQNDHIREFINKQKFSSICVVINESTIQDLIDKAEIIIIDWPTTTLLQVLTTNKQVFVLLKHLHLTEKAVTLLKKRAYCYYEPEKMMLGIHSYFEGVKDCDQSPDINNTDFLISYGIHEGKECVADRVIRNISVINQIH